MSTTATTEQRKPRPLLALLGPGLLLAATGVLPEAAGIVFGGRFPRSDRTAERQAAQRAIFHIQRELEQMADAGNAAVVLCDVEGLSYEEVAEVLDIKLGTVRSRIHRGRSQLRESLAHRAPRGATRLPSSAAMSGGSARG